MSEKEKSHINQERKQSASPVCYLDQFPGYFEGESVKHSTGGTIKKDTEHTPEP